MKKFSDAEREQFFRDHPAWSPARDGAAAYRKVTFADFNEAFGFMTRVAIKADSMDHHPEWSNVYNTVEVILTTHDADGLSARDAQMARFIDSLQ